MPEHHDTPKSHEPHAIHEEQSKGPHDPKEINPKMSSDIAYWSKEFGVTGDKLHEATSKRSALPFTPTKRCEPRCGVWSKTGAGSKDPRLAATRHDSARNE
jgi:hypothetical protein